jgi:hypothetical protein
MRDIQPSASKELGTLVHQPVRNSSMNLKTNHLLVKLSDETAASANLMATL